MMGRAESHFMTTCSGCDNTCRKPPYTCSGNVEPDFLTTKQRAAHQLAFERGETNWRTPFEPWVVRSWNKHMDETGGFVVADRVREGMRVAREILNDPNLTHKQKIKMITDRNTTSNNRKS